MHMGQKKRIRTPMVKPDQITVAWGRADRHSLPSLVYVYPDRAGKGDSRVLMEALEGDRFRPSFERFGSLDREPSMVAELEKRGYDITTLRLTIRRNAAASSG
ncbi:hypothetical protein ACEUZ9_005477 [Paracoccus litorisediminis]|uniref:hypothetical protein n=1 Tax=Paracoccus litorisediminis TaxID=2006130 RepID=UPI003730DA30